MNIAEPVEWPAFVDAADKNSCRLFAHPSCQGSRPINAVPQVQPHQTAFLAVGPEGGFTDEEAAQAVEKDWIAVDLGPRMLRTETAAIVLSAALSRSAND